VRRHFFPCISCDRPLEVPNFFGGGEVQIFNSAMSCHWCGAVAPIPNGHYSFIDDALQTLSAANENELQQLKAVAKAAASGHLQTEEAVAQALQIRPDFARLLKRAVVWGLPNLFVPLLTAYIAARVALHIAHGDGQTAEAMISELRAQREAIERSAAADERLAAAMEALVALERGERPPALKVPRPNTSQSSANGAAGSNRHQRRKAQSKRKLRGPSRL
jgi:hypothetical protein